MRSFALIGMVAVCFTASADLRYTHQKLWDDVTFINSRWDPPSHFINGSGHFATAIARSGGNMHAYADRTDLNAKYLPNPSAGIVGGINAKGQVPISAITQDSYHLMVDGRDFYRELFGPGRKTSKTVGLGYLGAIDEAGMPVWRIREEGEYDRVFHGVTELTAGMKMKYTTLYGVSAPGQAYWVGSSDYESYDLYRGSENISKSLVPGERDVATVVYNKRGDVLFSCADITNWTYGLDLNSTLLTGGYPDVIRPDGLALTDSGDYLWSRELPNHKRHLMHRDVDLVELVFGKDDTTATADAGMLNEAGDVLWYGGSELTSKGGIFLNQRNLDREVLGPGGYGERQGLDRFGHAIWTGYGLSLGNRYSVFVDDLNITVDALGYIPTWARSYAAGENGEVLWLSENPDETFTMWLSSPVPEPSAAVGVLFTLLVARRTRRAVRV